jgi:hypothetical protein
MAGKQREPKNLGVLMIDFSPVVREGPLTEYLLGLTFSAIPLSWWKHSKGIRILGQVGCFFRLSSIEASPRLARTRSSMRQARQGEQSVYNPFQGRIRPSLANW